MRKSDSLLTCLTPSNIKHANTQTIHPHKGFGITTDMSNGGRLGDFTEVEVGTGPDVGAG